MRQALIKLIYLLAALKPELLLSCRSLRQRGCRRCYQVDVQSCLVRFPARFPAREKSGMSLQNACTAACIIRDKSSTRKQTDSAERADAPVANAEALCNSSPWFEDKPLYDRSLLANSSARRSTTRQVWTCAVRGCKSQLHQNQYTRHRLFYVQKLITTAFEKVVATPNWQPQSWCMGRRCQSSLFKRLSAQHQLRESGDQLFNKPTSSQKDLAQTELTFVFGLPVWPSVQKNLWLYAQQPCLESSWTAQL